MDLLRTMAQNRVAKGVVSDKPVKSEAPPSKHASLTGQGRSFLERRNEIINNKPKNKVVKEFLEDLAEYCAGISDSDSDF